MASGIHHVQSILEPTTTNGANGHSTNGHSSVAPTSESGTFKLGSFSIDEDRPMKVAVIGAGFSGILAGIRFPQRIQNLELAIYEKNAGIGGTWYSNKYPGLACDFPSHSYQYSFEESNHWSGFYGTGPEIRAYLQGIVDKYKLMRYIKLQHELIHARYEEATGKWHLKLRRPVAGSMVADAQFEVIDDVVDLVFAAVGCLSRWQWPEIEGLRDFKGKLLHSADWDTKEGGTWQDSVKDWGDKKVGVIGIGSSSIQIVAAIQPHVKHIYQYVRGKAWLAPPFVFGRVAEVLGRDPNARNYIFTEEDRRKLNDPKFYKEFRHESDTALNSMHYITIKDSPAQKSALEAFRDHMRKDLARKPWIADHLMPDFAVGCRRITPGPGYLEALCEDNVDFVTTDIKKITETGIELVDGTRHEMDVVVCATGYDVSYQFPFTVVGRGGKTLQERYTPHPETYLGLCSDGFPNWFMSMGPNTIIGTGSLLLIMEAQVEYTIAATRKLQRERLKSIDVKKEAVQDFDEYLEHYFPTSVFSEKCRAWYKNGKDEGRVIGIWPGSSSHCAKAIERPRWEDYNYEPLNGVRNRFHWLGDGSTYNEKHMTGDRAWYLKEVDYPPVPQ